MMHPQSSCLPMVRRQRLRIQVALVLSWLAVRVLAGTEYTRGLKIVPRGSEPDEDETAAATFADGEMEPRHAVAVAVVSEGSKRHRLLEDLGNDDFLYHAHCFGVQYARKGGSSLTMYRFKSDKVVYTGKWTRSSLKAWLTDAAYPPINKIAYQIAPAKYLSLNPYGAVLVMQNIGAQTGSTVNALEKYAKKYKDLLKFTFFTKNGNTQELCESYGIWSNDEILLMEKPQDFQALGKHSMAPPAPKYRLENVTEERIDEFFQGYEAGTWPKHYKTKDARPSAPVISNGIRELTGWDFDQVVNDPTTATLVVFVSVSCEACELFAAAYEAVAKRVERARLKGNSYFDRLTIARIDQSANEHSQRVRGTPWLLYWAPGKRTNPVDVELRSADSIWDFLEGHANEEAEEASERQRSMGGKGGGDGPSCSAGSRTGCAKGSTATDERQQIDAGVSSGGPRGSVPSEHRVQLGKPAPARAEGHLSLAEEESGGTSSRATKPQENAGDDQIRAKGAAKAYLSTEVDPGEGDL